MISILRLSCLLWENGYHYFFLKAKTIFFSNRIHALLIKLVFVNKIINYFKLRQIFDSFNKIFYK